MTRRSGWVLLAVTLALVSIIGLRLFASAPAKSDRQAAGVGTADLPVVTQETERPLGLGRFLVVPRLPVRQMNYLVAGVTPEYSGFRQAAAETFLGLTDSLMILQLDPGTNRVKTLSLPRDTRVILPDGRPHKLNAALPLYGSAGLVQSVEKLTGLRLDGYLLVNLNAARALTDAVGGIDLLVPVDMDYDDEAANLHIHLKRGQQSLNGQQAEGYLRFRHDALGDIGRAQRQQTYVRALAAKLMTPAVLGRLPALAHVLAQNTRTNVSDADVSGLLGMMLNRPALETYLLPGSFGTAQAVSYWNVDVAAASRLLSTFGTSLTAAASVTDQRGLRVALIDAGTTPSVLRQIAARFTGLGYRRVVVSTVSVVQRETTVILSNTGPEQAQTARTDLGFGQARASGEGVLWADLTIWVGKDAQTLLEAEPGNGGP